MSCTNYLPKEHEHEWTLHAARGGVTVLSGGSPGLHRGQGYLLGVLQL